MGGRFSILKIPQNNDIQNRYNIYCISKKNNYYLYNTPSTNEEPESH